MGIDSAFTVLILAFVVASIGAVYRDLTSSLGRLYTTALEDVLGPLAHHVLCSPLNYDFRIRSPFQFTNIHSPGLQLPLSREAFHPCFRAASAEPL